MTTHVQSHDSSVLFFVTLLASWRLRKAHFDHCSNLSNAPFAAGTKCLMPANHSVRCDWPKWSRHPFRARAMYLQPQAVHWTGRPSHKCWLLLVPRFPQAIKTWSEGPWNLDLDNSWRVALLCVPELVSGNTKYYLTLKESLTALTGNKQKIILCIEFCCHGTIYRDDKYSWWLSLAPFVVIYWFSFPDVFSCWFGTRSYF